MRVFCSSGQGDLFVRGGIMWVMHAVFICPARRFCLALRFRGAEPTCRDVFTFMQRLWWGHGVGTTAVIWQLIRR